VHVDLLIKGAEEEILNEANKSMEALDVMKPVVVRDANGKC
jgi:hypothetical protein